MTTQNFTGLVLGDNVQFRLENVVDTSGNKITDLSGWTVFFTAKRTPLDADAAAICSRVSPTNIALNADVATWNMFATETSVLTAGRPYPYDVQLKDSGGAISTVRSGVLVFGDQVTIRTT